MVARVSPLLPVPRSGNILTSSRRTLKTRVIAALVVLASWSVVACGPEETSPGAMQSELAVNHGEVLLTYTQQIGERAEDSNGDTFTLSARFVRIRELGEQAERSPWNQDLSLVEVEPNECLDIPSSGEHVLAGSFDLLDAGELTLRQGDQETRIPDWSFPSVYGVVAGVAYGGDEALRIGFQPGEEYRLLGTGSEEISSIDVTIRAPAELTSVTVSGVDVSGGPVSLESAGGLDVRWEPGDDGNDVLVELAYAQFSTEERVICRSPDDGQLEVPAELAERLWETGVSEARLVIRRVQRQTFRTDGLDEGEAFFVVVLTVPLRIP